MTRFLSILLAAVLSAHLAQAQVQFWQNEWPETDFENTSVDFAEIMSGGPPKDGIPAIDDPEMIPVADDDAIGDREPVMTVELNGDHRAYPIRYLMWHEIANDTVGGVPVSVTFCPLCNSGIIFDRRVGDQVLSFGVSGKLRNSDMIMYDRETQSWWQQFLGEGVVGVHTGTVLERIPGWMESWADFKARNPDGQVMAQPNFRRRYGVNPYTAYDSSRKPFLYNGENPPHGIHPLARVVAIGDKAWPMQRVVEAGSITEDGLTLSWKAGTASALDGSVIADSKDVGAIRVKDADGNDVAHDVAFAFAFHAFHPDGEWKNGSQP